MNPITLKSQPALVTGANSGIGYAVAKALAAAGAPVVVNYVADPPSAERVVDEIRTAGGEAMAIRADVSKEDEVQAMFRKMFDAYGTIHILVNNAGLQRDARFVDMTLLDWEFVLSVNLTGQFLCARHAPASARRGSVANQRSPGTMMVLSFLLVFTRSFMLCDSPQLAPAVLFRVDGDSGFPVLQHFKHVLRRLSLHRPGKIFGGQVAFRQCAGECSPS